MATNELSPETKRSLAKWTPDGYECPECGKFNHVTQQQKLSDHVGEPHAGFFLNCGFCYEDLWITVETVTHFRADKDPGRSHTTKLS